MKSKVSVERESARYNRFAAEYPEAMIAGEFTGKIVEGVREGKGSLKWSNGDEYIGMFKNGLRHGEGPVPRGGRSMMVRGW